MPVTKMSDMWATLQTYTTSGDKERPVNHLNEWGGFSRRLGMPVFTGWSDRTTFDKTTKETKALILGADWESAPGRSNQEKWIRFAEEENEGRAAFFVIHAKDINAEPRKVESISTDRVFIGSVIREAGDVYIVGRPQPLT